MSILPEPERELGLAAAATDKTRPRTSIEELAVKAFGKDGMERLEAIRVQSRLDADVFYQEQKKRDAKYARRRKQPEVAPYDDDAERHALGSLLMDPSRLPDVAQVLGERTTYFYRGAHQVIYGAILRLAAKREPIDLYTVVRELTAAGEMERVGAVSFVYDIQESTPTAANAAYYAKVVREMAARRLLIESGHSLAERAGLDDDLLLLVEEGRRMLADVETQNVVRDSTLTAEVGMTELMAELESVYQSRREYLGIPTGFTELDRQLNGLQRGAMLTVAARPKMGKSVFAQNIAVAVARQGIPVLFFSCEMPSSQILTRMLAAELRMEFNRVAGARFDADGWVRVSEAASRLGALPLALDQSRNIVEIQVAARKFKATYPNAGLIVVDYLQQVTGTANREYAREQEVAQVARELKSLALELDVSLLALAQLNREVEHRATKRPQLSDLRESGEIEQVSDMVAFLYRDDYYDVESREAGKPSEVEFILAKNRNGAEGEVLFDAHLEFMLFQDRANTF